jgi:hypothetical protein
MLRLLFLRKSIGGSTRVLNHDRRGFGFSVLLIVPSNNLDDPNAAILATDLFATKGLERNLALSQWARAFVRFSFEQILNLFVPVKNRLRVILHGDYSDRD